MSRIGKNPIAVPNGVTIEINPDNLVTIKGPKGELRLQLHKRIKLEIADGTMTCTRKSESQQDRSLHGLSRTLLANMVEGVTKGFEKKLEIQGVGYRAAMEGKKINLSLGYSHPVIYNPPEEIKVEIDKDKKNILIITGIDKQMVGEVAAKIRGFKKPEPYKGKGIRYLGEHIVRKAGKAAGKDK